MPWFRQGGPPAVRFMLVALAFASTAVACSRKPLRPEPEALDHASPELIDRLRSDAYTYFRLINRPWIARVCDAFAHDLTGLPIVRLHGDAHINQFAITNDAWGLDDFDDSAQGPALVDIVRFLGSIDLAARQRSWEQYRDTLFDRFFEGYRRGLAEPEYRPPEPDIVRRLRAQTPATRTAFLAWGETQMQPMTDASQKAVAAGMEAFASVMRRERPDLAPAYFQISRAGWLRMGVGSAARPKILIRVQGPSADPTDDELLEAKEVRYFVGLKCIQAPADRPTVLIVDGARQLGRLKHNILAAGPEFVIPELTARGRNIRDWWIRSWDPSYREVRLDDLHSVDDLAAIAYDAGVQLGEGSLQKRTKPQATSAREQALASIAPLEKRLRTEAVSLVTDVLRGWREFGGR